MTKTSPQLAEKSIRKNLMEYRDRYTAWRWRTEHSQMFWFGGGQDSSFRLITRIQISKGESVNLRLNWGKYLIVANQESPCGYYGGRTRRQIEVSPGSHQVLQLNNFSFYK